MTICRCAPLADADLQRRRGASERLAVSKATRLQKPEALLYRIMMAATKPGGVVLDPFFGSGATGAVADKLGRRLYRASNASGYIEVARAFIAKVQQVPEGTYCRSSPSARNRAFP